MQAHKTNKVLSSGAGTGLFSRDIRIGNELVSIFWKVTFEIITKYMENISNHSSKAKEVITYTR